MSYLGDKDFLTEVQKGNVAGHSMVHKFGRNDGVGNSWVHISLLDVATSFKTAPAAMRVKAGGNGADTAAGAGAREITIQGIDDSFNEISEAVATAGASASSPTTAQFWRVHRAWVSAVGTYAVANTAAVTIEDAGGSGDMIQIGVEEGQTQYTGWTVPTGKTAYLLSAHVTVDGNKNADVRCFTRDTIDDVSAPMLSKRLKLYWDGIVGSFDYRPAGPELSISQKSDIWFEAISSAGAEVSCNFELLVVDN